MKAKTVTQIFVAVKLALFVMLMYSDFRVFSQIQLNGNQLVLFKELLSGIFLFVFSLVLLINAISEFWPVVYSRNLFKYETVFGFLSAGGALYMLFFKSPSIYHTGVYFIVFATLLIISIRNILVMKKMKAQTH